MKIDNNVRCKLESAFEGKIIRIMEGNSGRVFLVENNFTVPKFSAYKTCKTCKKRSDHYTKLFLEEAEKWNSIYSRNIIPIYKIVEIDEVLYICIRDASSTLEDILLSGVDSITAYMITLQLLNGLMDMEDSGILYHQDFNPPNILIEDLGHRFNIHGAPLFFQKIKNHSLCKYPCKTNHQLLEGLWHTNVRSWHKADSYGLLKVCYERIADCCLRCHLNFKINYLNGLAFIFQPLPFVLQSKTSQFGKFFFISLNIIFALSNGKP